MTRFYLAFYLSLCLLLFTTQTAFSQNYIDYHNDCNAACHLIVAGDYMEAKELLSSAINKVQEPMAADLFNLAKCYSQLNDRESTLYYLELAIEGDFRIKSAFHTHESWFKSILGTDRWNKVANTVHATPKEMSSIQLNVREQLNVLDSIDLHYRRILSDSIVPYYPNRITLIALYMDSMSRNDQVVFDSLYAITLKYGWPGSQFCGTEIASHLLLHFSEESLAKMDELLKQAIKEGQLFPTHYANIVDRLRRENNLDPLYNGYFGARDEMTTEVEKNCRTLGIPWGIAKQNRTYLRFP